MQKILGPEREATRYGAALSARRSEQIRARDFRRGIGRRSLNLSSTRVPKQSKPQSVHASRQIFSGPSPVNQAVPNPLSLFLSLLLFRFCLVQQLCLAPTRSIPRQRRGDCLRIMSTQPTAKTTRGSRAYT